MILFFLPLFPSVTLLAFISSCDTSAAVGRCKTPRRESSAGSENISHASMGLQIQIGTGRWPLTVPPLKRVFLHVPTSDIYMSAASSVAVSVGKQTRFATLTPSLYRPRTHDHKKRAPQWAEAALLHAAVGGENCCLCESIPKWLTAHLCVCTLL